MASLDYLNKTLKSACKNNDIEKIIKSIKAGADPNYSIRTIHLFKAVEENNMVLTKTLVENNANLYDGTRHLLTVAVQLNHIEIVEYLLNIGCDAETDKNLKKCATHGFVDILTLFYKHHADFSTYGEDCMRIAVTNSQYKVVEYLIDIGVKVNNQKNAPLARACLNNDISMIRLLIERGADPNANQYEAVKYAAFKDNVDVIDFLSQMIDKDIQDILSTEVGKNVRKWLDAKIMSDSLDNDLQNKQSINIINKI